MRTDMFQVIIERPRGGGGWAKAGRRAEKTARAWDRAPKHAGMKGARGRRTKWLNENLAPLIRFLRSHVGRPWSLVRSELTSVLSMSSAVQKHVLDHVRQLVSERVLSKDGALYDATGSWRLDGNNRFRGGFFVCPRTGLLRDAAALSRRSRRASTPPAQTAQQGG